MLILDIGERCISVFAWLINIGLGIGVIHYFIWLLGWIQDKLKKA